MNVKHKFTGQEYDAETGLYFYGARYYDPVLARFISADTMVPSPYNPQTLNRYSYCLNNPLKYTDPSGHFWWLFAEPIVQSIVASIEIAAMKYAADLFNHNNDPKHYPAPDGFSIGMSVYNNGEMSVDINGIQGIPFYYGGSLYGMGYGEDKRPINDPGMSVWGDIETTVTIATIPVGATIQGIRGLAALAFKGERIVTAATEYGYGIIAKNEGKIAGAETTAKIELGSSMSAVMGDSYKAVGEVKAQINNKELLQALNITSKGEWVKVYEAGIQNGNKVEMHYFRNNTTSQVYDVKMKYPYWQQKAFKNIQE